MKIKSGFVLRRVLDENIVVATGELSKQFHGMIKLNDTAADIWTWISEGKSEAEMAEQYSKEYGISNEKASEDISKMLKMLSENGFTEQ